MIGKNLGKENNEEIGQKYFTSKQKLRTKGQYENKLLKRLKTRSYIHKKLTQKKKRKNK